MKQLKRLGMTLSSLGLITGCNAVPFLPRTPLEDVRLTLEVTPTEQAGEVAIAGQTNLPNDTQLVVTAVRYLTLTDAVAGPSAVATTYAILDYRPVTVADGNWQATLNLWEVATDGKYRETWQIHEARAGLEISPEATVQFLVTLAPLTETGSLETALRQRGLQRPDPLMQTTLEGSPAFFAKASLPMTLPTGATTPPPLTAADINGGWGERYLLVPEPPLPYTLDPLDERKTNAPASAEEFMY